MISHTNAVAVELLSNFKGDNSCINALCPDGRKGDSGQHIEVRGSETVNSCKEKSGLEARNFIIPLFYENMWRGGGSPSRSDQTGKSGSLSRATRRLRARMNE